MREASNKNKASKMSKASKKSRARVRLYKVELNNEERYVPNEYATQVGQRSNGNIKCCWKL